MINTPPSTSIGGFTGTSISTVIGFDFASTATPTLSPKSIFAGGKQGVWYDPSDKSTLFQDVSGTVPVTKDGDPVALMRDKSGNGNHAVQSVSTSRPVYKTDGILHWLEFDGVDDHFATESGVVLPKATDFWFAVNTTGAAQAAYMYDFRPVISEFFRGAGITGAAKELYPNTGRLYANNLNGVYAFKDLVVSDPAPVSIFNANSTTATGYALKGRLYGWLMVDTSVNQAEKRESTKQYLTNKIEVTP